MLRYLEVQPFNPPLEEFWWLHLKTKTSTETKRELVHLVMLFVVSCGLYIADSRQTLGRLSADFQIFQCFSTFFKWVPKWVPMWRLQKFYPDEISLSLGVPGDLATWLRGQDGPRMDHGTQTTETTQTTQSGFSLFFCCSLQSWPLYNLVYTTLSNFKQKPCSIAAEQWFLMCIR